jgi:uncharacterized protein DUF6572
VAVEDADVVDLIGIAADEHVVLTISDDLEWDERGEHLLVLQDKLNMYLAFVESGELEEQYPEAAGRHVRIEVCCKHPPTGESKDFLSAARTMIEAAGYSLSWKQVLDA